MLNEKKLQQMINDTIAGICDQAISYDALDITIDCILENNGVHIFIEDAAGEVIENEDYSRIESELRNSILNDNRLLIFEAGLYAYNGQAKRLDCALVCNSKFSNPFEALNQEM